MAGDGGRVDWYRNLMSNGSATLEVGGATLNGRLLPTRDETKAMQEILQGLCAKYGEGYVRTWYEGTERKPVQLATAVLETD